MVENTINSSGECASCKTAVNEDDVLTCYDCKTDIHAVCEGDATYACKTFITNFKKLKSGNFLFVCNSCITMRENNEASTLKEQIADLTNTVSSLVNEFKEFKQEKKTDKEQQEGSKPWSDQAKIKKIKASLRIQSNGTDVNIAKVKEIATSNQIQVSKTTVNQTNGDVYIELPSEENRDKLTPLLNEETFAAHEVVKLKSKLPTISVLDVKEFESKENFVDKIKNQNPVIKELMERGSTFSVVYCKSPTDECEKKYHQVVLRVSEDIRKVIRSNNNKLFADLTAYRVVDRFYVKRCNRCQKFGHYEKDCKNDECCGYCTGKHSTGKCKEVEAKDHANHKCVNCKEKGLDPNKHSAMWYKCPTYIEMQKKLKQSIPFYQKN